MRDPGLRIWHPGESPRQQRVQIPPRPAIRRHPATANFARGRAPPAALAARAGAGALRASMHARRSGPGQEGPGLRQRLRNRPAVRSHRSPSTGVVLPGPHTAMAPLAHEPETGRPARPARRRQPRTRWTTSARGTSAGTSPARSRAASTPRASSPPTSSAATGAVSAAPAASPQTPPPSARADTASGLGAGERSPDGTSRSSWDFVRGGWRGRARAGGRFAGTP